MVPLNNEVQVHAGEHVQQAAVLMANNYAFLYEKTLLFYGEIS
jgi:hypothetical protein